MATKSGNRAEVDIDVEEVLADLEHKVERVKILYEQYFMGIEKIEPQTARKEISRKIMELTQLQIRNTALRYRFHALNQKFGAYTTYWSRTMREIENGTYFRSVARASRFAAEKGVDVPDEVMRALPKRLRDRILRDRERIAASQSRTVAGKAATPAAAPAAPPTTPAAKPAAPAADGFDQTFEQLFDNLSSLTKPRPAAPAPPPAPAAPPAPTLPPGMDETKVRELHRRYVAARRALGDAAEVRYEQILATVQKQGPKILEQSGARAVEFDVVLKDGKAILKATPRK
jgi:hypothetical protein